MLLLYSSTEVIFAPTGVSFVVMATFPLAPVSLIAILLILGSCLSEVLSVLPPVIGLVLVSILVDGPTDKVAVPVPLVTNSKVTFLLPFVSVALLPSFAISTAAPVCINQYTVELPLVKDISSRTTKLVLSSVKKKPLTALDAFFA